MRLSLFVLLLFIASFTEGQAVQNDQHSSLVVGQNLVFDQQDFGDRFAVKVLSEDDYDYYVIDLTKLGGRFERIYFLNLVFGDHKLINIDPGIDNSQLWFKAYYQYTESEILCLFDDLLSETRKISSSWTVEEKQLFLNKYDKYKIKTDDDR